MKRFGAIMTIIFIVLSTLTPLWGVENARAEFPGTGDYKHNPKNSAGDLTAIFTDQDNTENDGDFQLSTNSIQVSHDAGKIGITRALIKVSIKMNEKSDPALDDGKYPGYFDPEDTRGGWNAVLDDNLEFSKSLGTSGNGQNGIYLQLFEVPNGSALTAKDIAADPAQYDTDTGGPYYATNRIKWPLGANIVLDRNKFAAQITNSIWGFWATAATVGLADYKIKSYNIGPFFWRINPGNDFFNKRQISANIPLTDLKPDTTYYYRIDLEEVSSGDDAASQITETKKFTTLKEGEKDVTLEELESIAGTSNGSSEEGNKVSTDLFGETIACDIMSFSTWGGCLALLFYNTVYRISSWFLRGAAGLMDAFMAISLSSTIYQNSFIETGWTIVRDVCNIFFIFILLWTAFKMVINDSKYHADRVIINIVVIGLLINFSLFFSRVIIDMGNISARVFYNQIRITGSGQDQTDEVAKALNSPDIQPKAISEALANGLSLTNIQNTGYKKLSEENGGTVDTGAVWLILLLGTMVNLTAMWIFVKVSFAFLGRVLSLWVGMVMSPFAFTSTIIEHGPLEHIDNLSWDDWLKNMLSAAFYPALYLFFIFLIILLIQSDFSASIVQDYDGLTATPFLIMTLFKFMFIIGLLVMSGNFAKKISGAFGSQVSAFAGKAVSFVGGAAIGLASGGAAFVGRNTIGKAAGALGTEERISNLQEKAKKGGAGGWVARQQLKTIQGAQKASFDVRQTGAANKLSSATGMNMDALGRVPGLRSLSTTGSAGGIEGVRERKVAKMQTRADSLGENKKKKKEIEEKIKERKTQIESKEEELAQANAAIATDKANGGMNKAFLTSNKNALERELRNLKKTEKWTNADVTGTPAGPNGSPPAVPPAINPATGRPVTAADVGKPKDTSPDAAGLEDLEKALKNNSKALAREYMSNQIRRNSPAHIGEDKKDVFGNITELGHAHGVETTNRLLGRMLDSLNPRGGIGISLGAAVSGVFTNMTPNVMRLSSAIKEFTERSTNETLHDADHATAVGDGKDSHGHGPKYKSSYKGPSMNIFSGLFGGLGGGGGHGGGHDDHGHGGGDHGHDDHGGGHH